MNIIKRLNEPTPKFWKKVMRIGIIVGAGVGALLGAPITLPAAIVTVLTYVGTVAGTAVVVSKLAVAEEPDAKNLK